MSTEKRTEKILIVEDQAEFLREAAGRLEDLGYYDVIGVGSVHEAWDVLKTRGIDLILLDLSIRQTFRDVPSQENGLKLLSGLNSIDMPPVIVLTQEENPQIEAECLRRGAKDYVVKDRILVRDSSAHQALAIENLDLRIQRTLRERRIEILCRRDELTGVDNRAYIMARVEEEFDRAMRGDTAFSIAVVDVEGLRRINDTYGTRTGDAVLRTFGELLKEEIRGPNAVGRLAPGEGSESSPVCTGREVGRYSGGEFLILLPGRDGANAYRTVERIRARVEGYGFRSEEGAPIDVRISAGICALDRTKGHRSVEVLRREAARALQIAKREGGNRVVVA